jgi:hypothetical protein
MSSRERWTVYPLLMLAIGLALRAASVPSEKFAAGSIEAVRISCGEIVVTAEDGTTLVHIGRVKGGGGGRIEINDRAGVESISIGTTAEGRDGGIDFFDAEGQMTGRLRTGKEATPAQAPAGPE